MRLHLRSQNFKIKIETGFYHCDEVWTIRSDTAGLRCHKSGSRHVVAMQLAGADLQRLHRAAHREFRKTAGTADAFTQTNDAGERVDHTKAATGGARQKEPAVVGSKIKRAINLFATRRLGRKRRYSLGLRIGRIFVAIASRQSPVYRRRRTIVVALVDPLIAVESFALARRRKRCKSSRVWNIVVGFIRNPSCIGRIRA